MDSEKLSIPTDIWLDGNPVFSLNYHDREKIRYVDVSGFRPDPADHLKTRTRYPAVLTFVREKDYDDQDQWILRTITIPGQKLKFAYIR